MLRSMKYGLHGAVIAGLVAVPAVMNSMDTSVALVVDGRSTTVRTSADTVGQVLSDKGYHVTSHDLLAPSASTDIKDGTTIVLRRGRLLDLDVDGKRTHVWTTAPTIATAMTELGFTASDFVSVSRSQRLPLGPTAVAIRTPQVVTVVHDGQRQAVTTTDTTVGQLLSDLNLTVGGLDRLSAGVDAPIEPGAVIRLERVVNKTVVRTEALPFPTSKRKDAALAKGTTKVVRKGAKGSSRVTYLLVYVDGTLVGRTRTGATTISAPRAEVVSVGTKKVVVPANTPHAGNPDPGSAMAIAKTLLGSHGWGDDQYDCLVQMWNRESGWRVNAANPSGAYGIPQALPGSKMSSAGSDWQTNPATQIKWGLGYISSRYNTPCGAWSFWQAHNYY